MNYTVLWLPAAENSLAAIWADAADRSAAAADTIDALLRQDPHSRGESREGNRRVLFVRPLGVDYRVLEEDRVARVISVWRIP
jgi:hypothetical protein